MALATMPFLTRLYPATSFGYFAIYVAISGIAGSLSTLRFEYSVATADNENEASLLASFAIASIGLVTVISSLGIALIYFFHVLSAAPQSLTFWSETLISIALSGLLQVFTQVNFRQGTLSVISIRHIIDRSTVIVFSFVFAHLHFEQEGLILAHVLGLFVSVLVLWRASKLRLRNSLIDAPAKAVLKKYRDFPLKNLPSAALTLSTSQLPPVLYSIFYSAHDIGYLSLAQRLLDSPTSIIGSSLGAVYYRRMLQSEPGIHLRVLWRTLVWSVLVFSIPLVIAFVFAQPLIERLFGAAWSDSAFYLRALIPFSFVRLVFLVQQSLYVVIRRLDLDLMVSSALFFMQLLGLGLGIYLARPLLFPVHLSASLSCFAYLAGIALLFLQVRKSSSAPISLRVT